MQRFITQNDTVLEMKKELLEKLQQNVDECRKKYETCEDQVDFSTGGFRDFLLLQHTLAQRRDDEKNWRINCIFLIV